MKHYCNRQNMRKSSAADRSGSRMTYNESARAVTDSDRSDDDRPIFPPGAAYEDSVNAPSAEIPDMADITITSETQSTTDRDEARGGAISQMGGYGKQLDINNTLYGGRGTDNMLCYGSPDIRCRQSSNTGYNDMSRSFTLTSVPQSENGSPIPLSSYLNRYINKYICLSLWTADCMREEICGLLSEIGNEFLTLRREGDGCYTVIDLKTVRYINIYCI